MIDAFNFGSLIIDGRKYNSDLIIYPDGRIVDGWWRKSGHRVDVDDIKDILKSKPDILVIGKGKPGLMKSSRSLREFLKENAIELIEEKTSKAVQTFNRLLKAGKDVAAGFHVSC